MEDHDDKLLIGNTVVHASSAVPAPVMAMTEIIVSLKPANLQ